MMYPAIVSIAETEGKEHELRELVESYRLRCLWFLRPDFFPQTLDQKLRTLDSIRKTGDREAFVRASKLKSWLLMHSNEASAGS